MQWLAQVCVLRPVFASVLMLLFVVLGAVGYGKLGLDELPNADLSIVLVTARMPGGAPPELEADVTDKIEGAVNTLSGIEELRSISGEGVAQVVITFSLDKNVDVAAQEVRDKVANLLPELPAGLEPPAVSKVDLGAAPVLLVAVRSDGPLRATTEVADKLVRRQIESADGVGQVTLVGGRKRQINLWLDPDALRAADLTAPDVHRAVAAQNLSAPGGHVEAGPRSASLRVEGRVRSVEAVGRIVVREAGRPVRVEDVARVEDGEEEETSYAQYDDERAVVLSVRKQSGRNTVEVVDAVKARLERVGASLPAGARLEIIRDNSGTIRTGIASVTEHLVVGALLAALVVLAFLGNLRSTLIAALAIPISIVATFALMWALGFTLNLLTLLALALSIGIVIDDAIVVLENVVRRVETLGEKPFVAAVLGTREIGLAVLATTLSLLAVFVPVAFMQGLVGRFLKSFGLTMAFAIGVSMLVSFSLTPALAARWLRPHDSTGPGHLARLVNAAYAPLERAYVALLRRAMRRRWIVVLVSALSLGSCAPLASGLPGGFLPNEDRALFEVNARTPEGTSLTETRLVAERLAQDLRALPHVTHTLVAVGADERETPNLAKISVFLSDPATRAERQDQIVARVRREVFPRYPGLRLNAALVQSVSAGDAATQNIQYALTGPDLDTLADLATRVTDELRRTPGAVDVDHSLAFGKPELRVRIDRDRAADLGVRVTDVAETLRLFVAGQKASSYAEGGEEYDVRLRAEPRFRRDADVLASVAVPSSALGAVPLASVAHFVEAEGQGEISRLSRRRQVGVFANADAAVGENAVDAALHDIVARIGLPPGYALEATAFSKETEKTASAFLLAFGLSFVFMYLVLAAQFESWLHPITILLSLPLTVPFGLLSLHLFGQGINLYTALGLLVLFGVVKKNAILQVDRTNTLRAAGAPRADAILEANRERLRPILMTTVAFVAGMIPLMTAKGVGAETNHSTAGIVLGGQSLSLLLTLVATPVFYSLFDDASAWFDRRRRRTVDLGRGDLERLLALERPAPHDAESP